MTAIAQFRQPVSGVAPFGVRVSQGIDPAIDAVIARAEPEQRFLTQAWFEAAVQAYYPRSRPRTLLGFADGAPVVALPVVNRTFGATVPGCYWPFRSLAIACDAQAAALEAFMADRAVRRAIGPALRIGPVYDDSPALGRFITAARATGWRVVSRRHATSFVLDIAAVQAEGSWPRGSTLRKNRQHEANLARHGALDWRFVSGADWSPALLDELAEIERKSWIASETDGRDAKFTPDGHGGFWRRVAEDPRIAAMMSAAILCIAGEPAAFSFDLDVGALKYAIANSYDRRFGKHSPGKLLYYRNLVRAIERGVTKVDWGAGDSGYKRTIGAVAGPEIVDLLLLRPGIPAVLGGLAGPFWRMSAPA